VEALRKGQRPERGYIGVSLQPITDDIAASMDLPKNTGELIRGVTPGAGAARAGIQQGDVVVSVNGQPVNPDQSLAYLVSQVRPGQRVPIELIRDGDRRTVTVTVGARPTEEELAKLNGIEDEQAVTEPGETEQSTSQRSARESLGVTVQPLTPEIARSLRLNDVNLKGLVVAGVNPSSDAGQKLQQGDIILSINKRATRTPEEAAAVVAAARAANRTSVLLLVRRGNAPPVYVGIELGRK
jgi:serine protease Do